MKIDSNNDLYMDLNIHNIFNHNPVDVYINNIFIGSYSFKIGNNEIQIPKKVFPEQKLIIRFEIKNPNSPMDIGLSSDQRKLGIQWLSFCIYEKLQIK
jgi:hypothetical protein